MSDIKKIADKVYDNTIRYNIQVERFGVGVQRKVEQLLKDIQKEIELEIFKADPTQVKATTWKQVRLTNLNRRINEIVNNGFSKISRTVNSDLKKLAKNQSELHGAMLNRVLGIDLFNVTLTPELLEGIVTKSLIQGETIGNWFKSIANTYKKRVSRALAEAVHNSSMVQIGMAKGESVGELIRRVRGMETTYEGTIFRLTRNEADALVRTSVAQVSSHARTAMYQANDDLIKGYQIVATLDMRTTPLCRSIDGMQFDKQWKPLDKSKKAPISGPPPFHFRCRTTYIPILKTFDELIREKNRNNLNSKRLGNKLEQVPFNTRASMGGPVSGVLNYNDWLLTQPKEIQVEALGLGRWKLWSEGKVSLSDMVNQTGRPLTIQKLQELI